MLHVTNGDGAARVIGAAELGGEVLPWRDVLHEGPVPAGLPPEELRELRARWIAAQGWGDLEALRRDFERRDVALSDLASQDEVVLWFEADLYDQLQLIQILDALGKAPPDPRLSLVCVDAFPGVERFVGLGQLEPRQIAALFPARELLSEARLRLGREAWRAFRSPDPSPIEELLARDTRELPFLADALRRHLAQFPSLHNGLSRTEQIALEELGGCERSAQQLFLAQHERERRPFLGDATFYTILRRLAAPPAPLLEIAAAGAAGFAAARVRLTRDGAAVRAGDADAVRLRGIDRWLGGVHLLGRDAAWRWSAGSLVPRPRGRDPR